jgi:hypothetical protein
MLGFGWLVPAHLRAVDARVLQRAGRDTPTIAARGLELVRAGQLGPADLLARAAQRERQPQAGDLAATVATASKQNPGLHAWGAPEPGPRGWLPTPSAAPNSGGLPLTEFLVLEGNREKVLQLLAASPRPVLGQLLQTRELTNTTVFAPSRSGAGQAFDTAVAIAGLLVGEGKLNAFLGNVLHDAADQANRGGNVAQLEQVLLDMLSLGQRFNWGQLAAFVSQTEDAATLHGLTQAVRGAGEQLPALFAAVTLSAEPRAVSRYLARFPQSGLGDLASALRYGAGGVRELALRGRRFSDSPWRQWAATYEPFATVQSMGAYCGWRMPQFALILKWLLYLGGGFLLAVAAHFGRPQVAVLEQPLQVRGFHLARESLFAVGFLLLVLLLSEPFLAQEGQPTAALPLRLRVPTEGHALQAESPGVKASFMKQTNLFIMLLFFVLQGLLYTACVVKLAEIRRQRVGARMRLRLLENEEHLFDAGLYLGFLGTIVSFIVYSIYAQHQFSLMVAYSSTSFGILFVSVFKIFHLRPARRRLLLEAELESPEPVNTSAAASLASP